MKTDTLKLKVVMLAAGLVCLGSQNQLVAVPDSHHQNSDDLDNLMSLDDNRFFEFIVMRVKEDAVKSVINLIDSFVDKNSKETYMAYLKRCKDRLIILEIKILKPLRRKLEIIQANQPNSPFHKLLEGTYKLAKEMYEEMEKLVELLDKHRTSPDAKKAPKFIDKLKQFSSLTSPKALTDLENKIITLSNFITPAQGVRVKEEVEGLKKLIKDIKSNPPAFDKLAALTAITNKLKTL